ncbi:MAG TPA: hypothetical protein VM142_07615 [Acidimicrobiales bacterium]|nr:hypothetical protein [Acidimicrobiales bacterium]
MPLGRKPQLTGPDYLIAVASDAAHNGQPYAATFLRMAQDAAVGNRPGMLLAEMVAARPLKDYEASAVSIILGAAQLAQQGRDAESVKEILQFGMALLAKWPSYLVMTDSHPDLCDKSDSPGPDGGADEAMTLYIRKTYQEGTSEYRLSPVESLQAVIAAIQKSGRSADEVSEVLRQAGLRIDEILGR